MLFFQGKKDKRNQEADIQSMLIRKEVKSIFFAVVGTTFIFALLMMTGAYALTVHPLNPQNPLTMFASTPDGFTNNDPHTIQTIFATVRKAVRSDNGKFFVVTSTATNYTLSFIICSIIKILYRRIYRFENIFYYSVVAY